MKRFVSSVLVMMLTLVAFASVAMANVKFWTEAEKLATGKLINSTLLFRDTSMMPFGSAEKALAGVKEKLEKNNIENATITFQGEQVTKNVWGVTGKYYVAEAVAFELLEPTFDNMRKILEKQYVADWEMNMVFAKVVSNGLERDFAPYLLSLIKGSGRIAVQQELLVIAITTYGQFAKQEGIEELRKLFKYHDNINIKLAAGKTLIALGDRQSVESFVDNSVNKKTYLVEELSKVLMN
jgi:hypothetical protein